MSGFALIELLVILFLSVALFLAAETYGNSFVSAKRCASNLELLLTFAQSRALAGEDTSLEFDINNSLVLPSWRRRYLRFPAGCRIETAVFGDEGTRSNTVHFYSTGVSSAGRVELRSDNASHCSVRTNVRGYIRNNCR